MQYQDKRGKLPVNPDPQRIYGFRDVAGLLGICLHHTAGSASYDRDQDAFVTHVNVAKYHATPSRPGAKNHLSDRGAPGIAYTFFIEPDGTIVQCWDLTAKTWSQGWTSRPGSENAQFVGVCFAGNMTGPHNRGPGTTRPTPQQMLAGTALVLHLTGTVRDPRLPDHLWDAVPFGAGDVTTQSALGKPACPGEDIEVIARVAGAYQPDTGATGYDFGTIQGRQGALIELGYDLGRWGADGDWGGASRAALQAFQASAGLTVDGMWGRNTEKAIRAAL